jgi:hypothetical protein
MILIFGGLQASTPRSASDHSDRCRGVVKRSLRHEKMARRNGPYGPSVEVGVWL